MSFLQALANLNQVSWHSRLPGRRLALNTIVSLVFSFLMITFHLTNCLMPQNSRKTLKTVWWASVLNSALTHDFLSHVYYTYAYLEKSEFIMSWIILVTLILETSDMYRFIHSFYLQIGKVEPIKSN